MGTGVAVVEPGLGPHPAGRRRPWQHAKARRVGQEQRLLASRSRAGRRLSAGLEHAVGGAVGSVLEQDRARHADAARERARRARPRPASCRAGCRAGRTSRRARARCSRRRIRRATPSHAAARAAVGGAAGCGEAHRAVPRAASRSSAPVSACRAPPATPRCARLAAAALVQSASQRSAGAMQSIVSGPVSAAASSRRQRHRRPAAGAHRLDRLQQGAPVGHDHLVGRAQVLARAVLDRAHALHRPLVVQVDVVLAHAEVGARALLLGIEAPVVVAALDRRVVGKRDAGEALGAHRLLVERRVEAGEEASTSRCGCRRPARASA